MNDITIPYKKSVRYLGYYVQPNLKHNEHVHRVLLKAHTGLHKLYHIMKANNGVSQEVKIKTYTTILRPVLTYAVDFTRSRANFKFISTENLHKATKIPRLNIHMYSLAKNMLNKTYLHENTIVSNYGNFSNELLAKSKYKPPHSLLRSPDSKLLSL